MRWRTGWLVLCLFPTVTLLAQGPVPPAGSVPGVPGGPAAPAVVPGVAPVAAPVAVDPILMGHLRKWEDVFKKADTFYGEVKVTRENKARKSKQDLKGSIMCKKPGLARMRLEDVPPPGSPADPYGYISFISTGRSIVEYSGYERLVTETILPEGEVSKKNVLLDLLSGVITADAATKRFAIKLLKEDQYYVYLEMQAQTPDDLADFSLMRMVFFKELPGLPAYLPRQIIIHKPNGQEEELWEFEKVGVNVQGIKPEYFQQEPVPKDWKLVRQNAGPRRAGADVVPTGMQRPVVPAPGQPPRP